MDQSKNTEPYPVEWGVIVGIALGLSGKFPEAVLAAVAWFALRRIRPAAPSATTFVTSIVLAETFLIVLAILFSGLSSLFLVEAVVVLVVSLLLFFSEAQRWAYILLIYCVYVIGLRIFDLWRGVEPQLYNAIYGGIVVRIIMGWSLISFIRRPAHPPLTQQPPVAPPPDLPPIIADYVDKTRSDGTENP
jgi:hypothetical protein